MRLFPRSKNQTTIIPISTTAAVPDGPRGAPKSNEKSARDMRLQQLQAGMEGCMTGTRKRRIVPQRRDRHVMEELASPMRIIDREQTKVVGGFGSTTRVNARLLALTQAGLLRRFFTGTISGGRKAVSGFP